MPTIAVTVEPLEAPGLFEVRLAGRPLCQASRVPFCDAARRLLKLGFQPSATLVMRSPGSTVDRLRASLGVVAELTVAEDNRGAPRFRRWKPVPAQVREGSAQTAPIAPVAMTEPAEAAQ
jgi:hypothetical protein